MSTFQRRIHNPLHDLRSTNPPDLIMIYDLLMLFLLSQSNHLLLYRLRVHCRFVKLSNLRLCFRFVKSITIFFLQIVDRMNNIAAFVVWVPYLFLHFFILHWTVGLGGLPGFRALVGKSILRRSSAVPACRPLGSNQSQLAFNSLLFYYHHCHLSCLMYCSSSIKGIFTIRGDWFPTIHGLCCPFFFGFKLKLKFNIGYRQHACLYLELII